MDIHQYEYLLAIENHKSISGAARSLGISQPSLSNFLKKTEYLLGHQLFERRGQAMLPTEAGAVYLQTCRKIVNIKLQTYASIQQLNHKEEQTFTIGVTPYSGSQIFSECFPIFRQRYPNVKMKMIEGYADTLKPGLDNGEIDMVFNRITANDFDQYTVISLNLDELLLCVPLYHPKAALSSEYVSKCATGKLSDFEDLPFVMWGEKTTNRMNLNKYIHQNHVSLTVVYETNNALALDIMLQNDIGAGFLPSAFCLPDKNRVYFSMDPPLYSIAGLLINNTHVLTEPEKYIIYLVSRRMEDNHKDNHQIVHYNELASSIMKEFSES